MIRTTTSVNIKATTWSKNSEGLFDYESGLVSERNFQTLSSANILRTEDDVLLEGETNKPQNEGLLSAQGLVSLKKNKDSFIVCKNPQSVADPNKKRDNIWQVVKSVNPSDLSYRGYVLSEGDIIKLGKIKLRVRELKSFYKPTTDSSCSKFAQAPESGIQNEFLKPEEPVSSRKKSGDFIQTCNVEKLPEGGDFICRICLETQEDEKNPLITPCHCTGSVRHIHLECLKQWIDSKCYKKDYECNTIYMWKDLECELCHQILPDVFLQDNKEIELLNIIRPTDTYIILETLPEKKQIKKVFYVARFLPDNKASLLKVGRKDVCEVKVNDLSVSRLHAMLRHFDGVFYIENGFSKFGTLVLFQKEYELTQKHGLTLQIGKTVLNFELGTQEVIVEPEVEEAKSVDHVMNISATSEPEKKAELGYNYLTVERNDIFRKISDASTEMILNGVDSARFSYSDFPCSPDDYAPESASTRLIDSNQIKNDLEYLDQLLGSIKGLIEDRSRIMAEIEKNLVDPSLPFNKTDLDWKNFESSSAENDGPARC